MVKEDREPVGARELQAKAFPRKVMGREKKRSKALRCGRCLREKLWAELSRAIGEKDGSARTTAPRVKAPARTEAKIGSKASKLRAISWVACPPLFFSLAKSWRR